MRHNRDDPILQVFDRTALEILLDFTLIYLPSVVRSQTIVLEYKVSDNTITCKYLR